MLLLFLTLVLRFPGTYKVILFILQLFLFFLRLESLASLLQPISVYQCTYDLDEVEQDEGGNSDEE